MVCVLCGESSRLLPHRPCGPLAGVSRAWSCSQLTTTSSASWTHASSPLPGAWGCSSSGRGLGEQGALGPVVIPGAVASPVHTPCLRLWLVALEPHSALPNPTGMTRSRGSRPSSGRWPSRRAVCSSTSEPSTPRSGHARTAAALRAPAELQSPSRGLLVRVAQTPDPWPQAGAFVCLFQMPAVLWGWSWGWVGCPSHARG